MFFYTTGDLLQSSAQALVNTVNCEGYMGKGIAYQFKLQFPETNKDYVKVCKRGLLRPGSLHHYFEQEKIIINFPTKDKWREKSKMDYIEQGLDALILLITQLEIKSVALPPLGSGNGGLNWPTVKELICKKLDSLSADVEIYIYEPSKHYAAQPQTEPKLTTSALVLMDIKYHLSTFSKFRLQKAAYFMDLFSGKKYFKFSPHKYGPYDHSIDIISKSIREFQTFHRTQNTTEARHILYNKIVSESVNYKLSELTPHIEKACSFVNSIETDHELECLSTICFLIQSKQSLSTEEVIDGFKKWSTEKANRFSEPEIIQGIQTLHNKGVISNDLIGYSISPNI